MDLFLSLLLLLLLSVDSPPGHRFEILYVAQKCVMPQYMHIKYKVSVINHRASIVNRDVRWYSGTK